MVCVFKEGGLAIFLEGCPVAADGAVECDDGLEYATVVVRPVSVFRGQDYIPALIADEVFVVRGYEEELAFSEASGAAVVREVEVTAFPSFGMNGIS